jgi:hypothetical protein
VAPTERFNLPFRWEFVPVEQQQDRSVHWKWHAYSQTGRHVMSSEATFETLSECIVDARDKGYRG